MPPELQQLVAVQQRLQERLLSGPAQLQAGEHRGAVAGSLGPDGNIRYVYGEITGYYLHWLASLQRSDTDISSRAQAAGAWLNRLLAQASPPTRIYLAAGESDWRNGALFSFDLGMMAGGVAQAHARGLLQPDAAIYKNLQRHLLRFVDAGSLKASLGLSAQPLPERWSTRGGPFMAKTASRVLMLAPHLPLDSRLHKACTDLLETTSQQADNLAPDMLHPTLYALEGVMLAAGFDAARVGRALAIILQSQFPDGSLPESLQSQEVRRSDIIAQALRIGVLLQSVSGRNALSAKLDLLATCLAAWVDASGRLAFNPEAGTNEENVWCAMFAEQALRLYLAKRQGTALPFGPELLV